MENWSSPGHTTGLLSPPLPKGGERTNAQEAPFEPDVYPVESHTGTPFRTQRLECGIGQFHGVNLLIDQSLHPSFHSRINSPVNMNEVNDTNVNNSVQFIYENNLDCNLDSLFVLNTSLNGFQVYSPVLKHSIYKHLGNLGLANQNLIFSQIYSTGIDLGINNFDVY